MKNEGTSGVVLSGQLVNSSDVREGGSSLARNQEQI
jgi:hypothetical protein